jgi:phage head maturation protease
MSDETIIEWRSIEVDAAIEVRDITKRELDVRLVPWNVPIDTLQGREEFNRGAFSENNPASVFLMGMMHEAHLGLGQDGRAVLTRRPVGKALRLDDRADAGYATFRVAKTQSGDEILTLAEEGIVTGVSIEFSEVPGGSAVETRNGRRVRVHNRVALRGASTTYRPAYAGSAVIAVRSEQGDPPVPEQDIPAAVPAPVDLSPIMAQLQAMQTSNTERFAELEEHNRSQITIPSAPVEVQRADRGEWMSAVLRMLSGERIPQEQMRTLDDLVTSDNIGVVPPTYSTDVIGVISRAADDREGGTPVGQDRNRHCDVRGRDEGRRWRHQPPAPQALQPVVPDALPRPPG